MHRRFLAPHLLLLFALSLAAFPAEAEELVEPDYEITLSVIDIDHDRFAEDMDGGRAPDRRVSWVAGELVNVTAFGTGRSITYKLQLRIDRYLFGDYVKPQTIEFHDVNFSLIGYHEGNTFREPKAGDQVFVKLSRYAGGGWHYGYGGVPSEGERKRIARLAKLLSRIDQRAVAQELIAGCRDADPIFASWCMKAITPIDIFPSSAEEKFYGKLRAEASAELYRETLLELLEDPNLPAVSFVNAMQSLAPVRKLSPPQQARFNKALYERLKNHFTREPAPFEQFVTRDELEFLSGYFSIMPESIQRDILLILAEFADHESPERQTAAFDMARDLYSEDNDGLNEDILRIYSEHVPAETQQREPETTYWIALTAVMRQEAEQQKRLCDPGLYAFAQRVPTSRPNHLRWLLSLLGDYAATCKEEQVEWDRLADRLSALTAVAATPEQRKLLNEFLRGLGIEPQDTANP